jgi:AcrR family transcriptional regulator
MSRATTRSDKTRRHILDAAEQHFLARGYTGTRVEEVAAAAHVSVGTVYLHYASKEGLYAAVLARAQLALLDDYLAPVFELDLPPWERILAWCHAYVQFTIDHSGRARLMAIIEWWEAARPPELDRQLRERVRESDAQLCAVFQEAADAGELGGADPARANRVVSSSMYGICALNIRHDELSLPPDALHALVDAGLRLVSGGRVPGDADQIDA